MKYVAAIILTVAVFFVGSIIRNPWTNKSPAPQTEPVVAEPTAQNNESIQKLTQERDKALADKKSLEDTMNQLEKTSAQTKADYETRLAEYKKAIWEEKIKNLGKKDATMDMGTSKPKNDMISNAVKTQIGKIYRDRIKKLDKKALLSDEQKGKIEKLNEEQVFKVTELTMKMLSGDVALEDLNKEDMDTQYEQKIKDILTPEQNTAYQEILKEEKEAGIKQAVTLFMNGAGPMKGISESVNLSDEQKKQVQELYSELLHNPVTTSDKANTMVMPFENKEFVSKIRNVLTEEQYPQLEEYLKEQAEFYESMNLLKPKKKE
jgi:hypothetical protein